MNQIPNYIIVLDFVQSRVIKIKLSDEEKQFASSCDDLEELVDGLSDVYHFSMINCQWMALDECKEDNFGGYWWLPKIKEFPIVFYTENQLLTKSCPKVGSSRGTKMGQNLLKTYLAIFFHDVHVIKDLCYSFAKVHNYCETNEGNPLNLSFAVHFSATCTDNGIFG